MAGLTDSTADPVDVTAFDAVYRDSRARVVRTAFLVVGSRAVAEEIAQEAFLRLHEHFDEVENPGGFLHTTTVRLAISWRRRATVEADRLAVVGEPGPTGSPELDETWGALAALSPERRAAVVLRFYDDLDYAAIAAAMGCRTATARTRCTVAWPTCERSSSDEPDRYRAGVPARGDAARQGGPGDGGRPALRTRGGALPGHSPPAAGTVARRGRRVRRRGGHDRGGRRARQLRSESPERNRPAGGVVEGAPVARLAIAALPELRYDPAELTTVAGVNEIELVDRGGTHTLVFEDPALAWFRLEVPNGTARAKVELEPGRDYTFFCVIPGHRAAGMEGVIHVLAEDGPSTAPVGAVMNGSEQHLTVVPVPDESPNASVAESPFAITSRNAARRQRRRRTAAGVLRRTAARWRRAEPDGTAASEDRTPATVSRTSRATRFRPRPRARRRCRYGASDSGRSREADLRLAHLPAGTAFVTYEFAGSGPWQRPVLGPRRSGHPPGAVRRGPTYEDWARRRRRRCCGPTTPGGLLAETTYPSSNPARR